MVSWGTVSPYLEPRTPSSLFFPMTHMHPSPVALVYGPMFARRRGLIIAPRLLHVGGHGQASPSLQTATLPKSSEEIRQANRVMRHRNLFKLRRAEAPGARFAKEMTLRRLELKAEMIKSHE